MPFDPLTYWERRYRQGGDSGDGSRGAAAEAKADYLNDLIDRYRIASVVDWGCGDGTVMAMITDRVHYTGVDLSPTVIDRHRATHPGRAFILETGAGESANVSAELAVSADVLHHFIDDTDFDAYLERVFGSGQLLVAIWSTDHDGGQTAHHVRWRHFTGPVADRFPDFELVETVQGRRRKTIDPESPAWYLFQRAQEPPAPTDGPTEPDTTGTP